MSYAILITIIALGFSYLRYRQRKLEKRQKVLINVSKDLVLLGHQASKISKDACKIGSDANKGLDIQIKKYNEFQKDVTEFMIEMSDFVDQFTHKKKKTNPVILIKPKKEEIN